MKVSIFWCVPAQDDARAAPQDCNGGCGNGRLDESSARVQNLGVQRNVGRFLKSSNRYAMPLFLGGSVMTIETTARKIGNSQGIAIPNKGAGLLVKRIEGTTLRERMCEWDGNRYIAPEIDWGKPVGSELW